MRFSVPKIKFLIEDISNVSLPPSLALMIGWYVILFTFSIGLAIYCEVSLIHVSIMDKLYWAMAAVLSLLNAFLLMANSRWSFYLLLGMIPIHVLLGFSVIDIFYLSESAKIFVYFFLILITAAQAGILCFPGVRIYYFRITGKEIPEKLMQVIKDDDGSSNWHLSSETSATILEVMVIVVALLVFSIIFTGMVPLF